MHSLGGECGLPANWIFLSNRIPTAAEILRKSGFSTAAFHSNPWISSFFNYDKGFQTFDDGSSERRVKSGTKHRFHDYLLQACAFYKALMQASKEGYRADIINEKAISWLRKRPHAPFFLWLHFMDVHEPYVSPASTFLERIKAIRFFNERTNPNLSENELKTLVELYDNGIKYVDHEIGVLLNGLEKLGFSLDDTYVLLTADHGDQLCEHGRVGHSFLYDEVIRVPRIICGPEIVRKRSIRDQVSLLDLIPTIADLLEINRIGNVLGSSLLPVMEGEEGENSGNKGVISEVIRSHKGKRESTSFSYRTEEWKYIVTFHDENIQTELYKLGEDTKERCNITDDPVKRKEMGAFLSAHIQKEKKIRRTRAETSRIRKQISKLKSGGILR